MLRQAAAGQRISGRRPPQIARICIKKIIFDGKTCIHKKNRLSTEADTLIRVSGRSMEPVYHNGDLVYVKYTKDVENNDIVICSSADGAVIKRMYDNKLYSLNPQYPYGEKSEDDHVQVVGKVLGTVSADEIPDAEDVAILRELKAEELYEFEREDP